MIKQEVVKKIIQRINYLKDENYLLRQQLKQLKLKGVNPMNPQSGAFEWNKHDLKVIIFQVIIAGAQALLMGLAHFSYGPYTPDVALGIQVLAEAIRRLVIS
ncbi:MAG TPA: hypothetical protein VF974_07675 [Patescibacteria group bacterium]